MPEDWTTKHRGICLQFTKAEEVGFIICGLKKGDESPPVTEENSCTGNPYAGNYINCKIFKGKEDKNINS